MKGAKFILPLLFLASCIQKTTLKNGRSRVATNPKVYKNRIFFDKSILNGVDTLAIYEEYNTTFYIGDKPVNVLARHNIENPNHHYSVYRFYGNGNFNKFYLDRNNETMNNEMFNPEYNGTRGVLYKKNGEIKGDMFAQINGAGGMGVLTATFKFKDDTLFYFPEISKRKYIFIKRNIDKRLL